MGSSMKPFLNFWVLITPVWLFFFGGFWFFVGRGFPAVQPSDATFLDWVGATDGWAAALVGIGAIVAAYKTIQTMQMQTLIDFGKYKDQELAEQERQWIERLQSANEAKRIIERAENLVRQIDPTSADSETVYRNARSFGVMMIPSIEFLNQDPRLRFSTKLHVNTVRVSVEFAISGIEKQYSDRKPISATKWFDTADLLKTAAIVLKSEHRWAQDELKAVTEARAELNEGLAKRSGFVKGD
jgi:hypothetical protein